MTAPPAAPVGPVPLVEVRRGGLLEGVHSGSVAVADAAGAILVARGAADQPTFLRSSAKLFQAITVVATGAADRFGFTAAEVAVICASHGAQPFHLDAVRSILAKAGLSPDALQCGPHAPMHGPSADALVREGRKPERIHNNCSGKHAGMLAVCRHRGWPTETYHHPDHPLQVLNRQVLAAFAGVPPEAIPVAVDGCGVPTFYLPLTATAVAWARLVTPAQAPPEFAEAARRVVQAVATHPVHVAWEGQFGALLGQHLGPAAVGKIGAEGVFCAGVVDRGIGMAVKIADGGSRALAPVLCRLLEPYVPLESLEALRRAAVKPVTNTRGEAVGALALAPW